MEEYELKDIASSIKRYYERLETFKYYSGAINPETLAYAGYTGTIDGDWTICPLCFTDAKCWKKDENPWLVHYNAQPNCVFFNSIIERREMELAKRHVLNCKVVTKLVKKGRYNRKDIKKALNYALEKYNIYPYTKDLIVKMTDLYLNEIKYYEI